MLVTLLAEYDTKLNASKVINSLEDFRNTEVYKSFNEDERFYIEAVYGEPLDSFELRPEVLTEEIKKFVRKHKVTVLTFEYRPEFPEYKSLALVTVPQNISKQDFNYIIAPQGIKEMFKIKDNEKPILFLNKRSQIIGYIPDRFSSDQILDVYNNLGGK